MLNYLEATDQIIKLSELYCILNVYPRAGSSFYSVSLLLSDKSGLTFVFYLEYKTLIC